MTKAADVYGFSMLAWELFTGEQLFQGLRQSQVLVMAALPTAPSLDGMSPFTCFRLRHTLRQAYFDR